MKASILEDAFHPQTILAYELNDEILPIKNGAPLRLRLERQLGYKMAKYVMRLEVINDLSMIAGGKGGYCKDQGYEWYAGIVISPDNNMNRSFIMHQPCKACAHADQLGVTETLERLQIFPVMSFSCFPNPYNI